MLNERLQISLGFATDTGKREDNQDFVGAYLASPSQQVTKGIVAAVADGVGGNAGGRQAAELTVRHFIDAYYGLSETLSVEQAAAKALTVVNRWIFEQSKCDSLLKYMATTFSAVILRGRQIHFIHIGDTRIYRLRDDNLICLTQDHTLKNPNLNHVLYRAVGLEEGARADYAVHNINLHDRYLLCSDGVHGALKFPEIKKLLQAKTASEDSAKTLVKAALSAGSNDNVTALVIDVVGLPAIEQLDLETAIEQLPIKKIPNLGDVIDDFTIEMLLAKGRYSQLFVCHDNLTHRQFVIKFPQQCVAEDITYHRAFIREAWIGARVNSTWVADIIELAPERQTCLYSVMPYYQGITLTQRIAQDIKMPLQAGAEIGIKLGKAIYALNRLQIIHRDIKPDNLILLNDGGLKLLDLGVALLPGFKEFPNEDIPGTPSFMAPELFQGEQGNTKTDVYAFGVTLYQLFSGGHYPYGEVEAFSRPRFRKYTPLPHHRPDLPAWLDALIMNAVAVDPNKRFSDTMELTLELENSLIKGGAKHTLQPTLYQKNPVLFWQIISVILLIAFIASLTK